MTPRTAGLAAGLAATVTVVVGVLAGPAAAVVVVQVAAAIAIAGSGYAAVRPPKGFPRPPGANDSEAGRRQWSSLHQLGSTVMIALQSPHHYDAALRPRLQRVLSAVLSGRRGIDLAARPDLGRTAIGAELWPLLDPARPASRDSRPGGVHLPALEALLDRIERL